MNNKKSLTNGKQPLEVFVKETNLKPLLDKSLDKNLLDSCNQTWIANSGNLYEYEFSGKNYKAYSNLEEFILKYNFG